MRIGDCCEGIFQVSGGDHRVSVVLQPLGISYDRSVVWSPDAATDFEYSDGPDMLCDLSHARLSSRQIHEREIIKQLSLLKR